MGEWRLRKRYAQEFVGRQNIRGLDTLDRMAAIARGLEGKRLKYRDLVGPQAGRNNLTSAVNMPTAVTSRMPISHFNIEVSRSTMSFSTFAISAFVAM